MRKGPLALGACFRPPKQNEEDADAKVRREVCDRLAVTYSVYYRARIVKNVAPNPFPTAGEPLLLIPHPFTEDERGNDERDHLRSRLGMTPLSIGHTPGCLQGQGAGCHSPTGKVKAELAQKINANGSDQFGHRQLYAPSIVEFHRVPYYQVGGLV